MDGVSPTIVMFLGLFAIFVLVLWIMLPFAVFGIKKRLDALIELSRQANEQRDKQ